jgi:RHS repeat-associated protein
VNSLGLTESVIEPSTVAHPAAADRTWTTSYDVAGNAVKLAEPGGVNRTRTFDAAGRLTNEAGSGAGVQAADRKAGYDALGRVTSINSIGADNTYTYNDRWQVLSATGPSGSASFSFDADGSLVQRADASGTANFGYTKGRLTSVTDSVTRTAQTFGYDNAGAPKTIDYGLGRARTFEYDELGRLKSDGLKNSAGTTVSSVAYTFDLSNNLTGKTTTGVQGAGANTYTYDDAGRLKSWTGGGKATTYGWDDAGNRVSADGKTARFDERNRLITDGTADYSYSARGTLLSKTTGSTTDSTAFDAFDRVISQGGRTYQYDGADRPVTGNGTTMQYAGFSDEVVADGTQIYGRGLGDDVLSIGQGTTKRLTMSDSHSDVVGGFDPADGTLAALPDSRTYDPFGKIAAAGGLNYGVGYQGDWNDPATGDSNMGARWYDPDTGTFTSRDTISYSDGDSATANKYLYGNANPLANIDPTGNSSCPPPPPPPGQKPPTRNGGHDTDEGDRWPPPYVPLGYMPGEPDGNIDTEPWFDWTLDGLPRSNGMGGVQGRSGRGGGSDLRILGAAASRYASADCPGNGQGNGKGNGNGSTHRPKPPPPPDPAIKARKDLERDLKNNPQPNARGISDPLFSHGNPFGGGNWNFVDDIRGQTAAIYQAAVAAKGVAVAVAGTTFSAWGTGLSAGQLGGALIGLGGAYSLSQIDQPPGFESILWPSLTGLVPQVGLLAQALGDNSGQAAQPPHDEDDTVGAIGGGRQPEDRFSRAGKSKDSKNVALGLRDPGMGKEGLRTWADSRGFTHYLDDDAWEAMVRRAAHDPDFNLHIKLDGMHGKTPAEQFESAYRAGRDGPPYFATDREMYHVGKAVSWGDRSWDSITFYRGNNVVKVPKPKFLGGN